MADNLIKLGGAPGAYTSDAVTVDVQILVAKLHNAGDEKQYFGNEKVNPGDPIVDAVGNLQFTKTGAVITYTPSQVTTAKRESFFWIPTNGAMAITLNTITATNTAVVIGTRALVASTDFTVTGNVLNLRPTESLQTGAHISVGYIGEVLHGRGDPVYIPDTQNAGKFVVDRYSATDPVKTLGNEPVLYSGGQNSFYTAGDAVQVVANENRVFVDGVPGDVLYSGLGTVNLTLGDGANVVTVVTTHTGTTNIATGAGDDQIAVRAIRGPTNIASGAGNDAIFVGSQAGQWPPDHTTNGLPNNGISGSGIPGNGIPGNGTPGTGTPGNGITGNGLPTQFIDVRGNSEAINAVLTIDAGAGNDVITVDDTTDSSSRTGDLTASTLDGIFGTNGHLVYRSAEALNINLSPAGHTFNVHSTHTGVTYLKTGDGNDTVNVETISGLTYVNTQGGYNLVRIGTTTSSNPPASLLAGIASSLSVDGGTTGDSLLQAYDTADNAAVAGTLTGDKLTGFGMGGGIHYRNFAYLELNFGNGVNTLTVADTHRGTTHITTGAANDVVKVQTVSGPTAIDTGAGDDVVNVSDPGFVDLIGGLLTLDTGTGNNTVTVDNAADTRDAAATLTSWTLTGLFMPTVAQEETIDVRAASGTYDLAVQGLGKITLDYAATGAQVAAALQVLYGTQFIAVDERRTTSDVTYTVLFMRPQIGVAYGALTPGANNLVANLHDAVDVQTAVIHVGSTAPDQNVVQTIKVNATGGTYALHFVLPSASGQLNDFVTSPIAYNASAGDLQNAILATLNASSIRPSSTLFNDTVVVEQHAGTFEITYRGPFRHLQIAYIDTSQLTGTAAAKASVMTRSNGIDYYSVQTLNVNLGQGTDVFNVESTSAVTNVNTGAGDDRVYVSSNANFGVNDHPDFITGVLANVAGTLNIAAGSGRHTLMISDEGSVADDGNALITRSTATAIARDAHLANTADGIYLLGFAPAGISYGTTGSFAGGITVWTGSGKDVIEVDATHYNADPTKNEITTLNTGLGSDTVTVRLSLGTDGMFVLNTQGPYDNVLPMSQPMFTGDYNRPADQFLVNNGTQLRPAEDFVANPLLNAIALTSNPALGVNWQVQVTQVQTFVFQFTLTGSSVNVPQIQQGDQVSATVNGMAATTSVNGTTVTLTGQQWPAGALVLVYVKHTLQQQPTVTPAGILGPNGGANDSDTVNAASSSLPLVIFGGEGNNKIYGGTGGDIILGHRGRVLYSSNVEGQAATTVLGHGGPGDRTDGVVRPLGLVENVDPAVGGDDQITEGNGSAIILGGSGNNNPITAGNGTDIVMGANGQIDFAPGTSGPSFLADIMSTFPAYAGTDVITVGNGNDIVIGGTGSDLIHTGTGADIVYGDNATLNYNLGVLNQVMTTYDNMGSNDTIYGGGGADLLVGGPGNNAIDGGSGNDIIVADNAELDLMASPANPRFRTLNGSLIYDLNSGAALVNSASSADPTWATTLWWASFKLTLLDLNAPAGQNYFGSNYIAGGAGNKMIFGGPGDDVIQGHSSIDTNPGYTLEGTARMPLGLPCGVSGKAGYQNQFVFANLVGACRDLANNLWLTPSHGLATDGSAYIEGGGGNNEIFGDYGQNDIVGGNSDMFGQLTSAQRSSGSNMIFGGDGLHSAREDAGDLSANGHAHNSDVIVGNNGDIYRLTGVNGTPGNAFLTFNYDLNGYLGATEHIVARAVKLLDYTPGGPDLPAAPAQATSPLAKNDIGGTYDPTTNQQMGDEIHAEQGDAFIYGGPGNDRIFGGGQNDTIITGYGNDWVSGGAGDSCIIGGDGRCFASRAGFLEPLYGVLTPTAQQLITTPGNIQQAMINVKGALQYTALINPGPPVANTPPNPQYRTKFENDIIYGGWGNDNIHGGPGSDAISGADAPVLAYTNNYDMNGNLVDRFGNPCPNGCMPVESDWYRPFNPGNALGFTPATMKFALFNPSDPRTKVMLDPNTGALCTAAQVTAPTSSCRPWILYFTAETGMPSFSKWLPTGFGPEPSTGDDAIFGDFGNDWILGGMGRVRLFGGWGNDILDLRASLDVAKGLNNSPVPNPQGTAGTPAWEGLAFGGAGQDILIAGTGGDRLIDWVGNHNTYLVPFAPFGMPTVSRTVQPALPRFLYQLSQSDGADLTLGAREGSTTSGRNGEPFGELGVVLQADAAWHQQTGPPFNPMPGNLGGVQRDVRVTAGNQPINSPGTDPPPVPPAVSAPTLVDNNGQIYLPLVINGPSGSSLTYKVTDGVASITGAGALNSFGTFSVTLNVSTLANGPLTITATVAGQGGGTVATSMVKSTSASASPTISPPAYVNLVNRTAVPFTLTGPPGMYGSLTVSDGTYTADAGGTFDPVTGSLVVTVDLRFLADGTLATTAFSMNANGSTATTTGTVVKDTVVPAMTVTGVPQNYLNSNTAKSAYIYVTAELGSMVTYSLSDGVTTYSGSKQMNSSGQWNVPVAFSGLNDGPIYLIVTATDVEGNPNTFAPSLIKDTVAPAGSFTVAGTTINGTVATTNPTLTIAPSFTAASGIASVLYSINGGPAQATATLLSVDGLYTVTAQVTSNAGNFASFSKSVRLDRAGPTITSSITAPTNAGSYDVGKAVTLTYTASDVDNVASVSALLDGATSITSGVAFNSETLTPGAHTIVITAKDGLGNISTTTLTLTVHATVAGLTTAVNDGVTAGKITSSTLATQLKGYLSSAQAALTANNHAAAKAYLGSFVTAVGSAGSSINAAYASLLQAWANDLIARL